VVGEGGAKGREDGRWGWKLIWLVDTLRCAKLV
jgi:hypothetical protein